MKKILYVTFLLIGFSQTVKAQSAKDVQIKLIEKVVGSWQLQEVLDSKSKKSNTSTFGITGFEFSPEGRYTSLSKGTVLDSGSYRLNEPQRKLYLESDASKENPSEWVVSFQDDRMTLKPQGVNHAAGFQYVFIRTKKGLSTSQK